MIMQDDQEFDAFVRRLKPNNTVDEFISTEPGTMSYNENSSYIQFMQTVMKPLVDRYNIALKTSDYAELKTVYDQIVENLNNFTFKEKGEVVSLDENTFNEVVEKSSDEIIEQGAALEWAFPSPGVVVTELIPSQELADKCIKRGSNKLTEFTKNAFLTQCLPLVEGKSVSDFISEIQGYKSELTYTPTKAILAKFYAQINGVESSLIETLDKEFKGFISYKSLGDYLLKSKDAQKQLQAMPEIIDLLEDLLTGATNGVNAAINKTGGKPLLVLSTNAKEMIVKDLQMWRTRVNDLLDLAGRNSANKLNEQKDIAINCANLFKKRLIDDDVFNNTFVAKTGLDSFKSI